MLKVRIVSTDFCLLKPLAGLDAEWGRIIPSKIYQVPVIRIFGSTPLGQKCCLCLHGIYPYLYIGCSEHPSLSYLKQFAINLNKAININLGYPDSYKEHVFNIETIFGISFYGYNEKEKHFLKIYLYNPLLIKKVADLLLSGAVMGQSFQPHESHIPYILQTFIDNNLFGMNFLFANKFKFRKPIPETFVTQQTDEENCFKELSENASFLANYQTWTMQTISEDMIVPHEKQTRSSLEIDIMAEDILNKCQINTKLIENPGLRDLWQDEKRRCKEHQLPESLTPPSTPERNVDISCDITEKMRLKLKLYVENYPLIKSNDNHLNSPVQKNDLYSEEAIFKKPSQSCLEDKLLNLSQSSLDNSFLNLLLSLRNFESHEFNVSEEDSILALPTPDNDEERIEDLEMSMALFDNNNLNWMIEDDEDTNVESINNTLLPSDPSLSTHDAITRDSTSINTYQQLTKSKALSAKKDIKKTKITNSFTSNLLDSQNNSDKEINEKVSKNVEDSNDHKVKEKVSQLICTQLNIKKLSNDDKVNDDNDDELSNIDKVYVSDLISRQVNSKGLSNDEKGYEDNNFNNVDTITNLSGDNLIFANFIDSKNSDKILHSNKNNAEDDFKETGKIVNMAKFEVEGFTLKSNEHNTEQCYIQVNNNKGTISGDEYCSINSNNDQFNSNNVNPSYHIDINSNTKCNNNLGDDMNVNDYLEKNDNLEIIKISRQQKVLVNHDRRVKNVVSEIYSNSNENIFTEITSREQFINDSSQKLSILHNANKSYVKLERLSSLFSLNKPDSTICTVLNKQIKKLDSSTDKQILTNNINIASKIAFASDHLLSAEIELKSINCSETFDANLKLINYSKSNKYSKSLNYLKLLKTSKPSKSLTLDLKSNNCITTYTNLNSLNSLAIKESELRNILPEAKVRLKRLNSSCYNLKLKDDFLYSNSICNIEQIRQTNGDKKLNKTQTKHISDSNDSKNCRFKKKEICNDVKLTINPVVLVEKLNYKTDDPQSRFLSANKSLKGMQVPECSYINAKLFNKSFRIKVSPLDGPPSFNKVLKDSKTAKNMLPSTKPCVYFSCANDVDNNDDFLLSRNELKFTTLMLRNLNYFEGNFSKVSFQHKLSQFLDYLRKISNLDPRKTEFNIKIKITPLQNPPSRTSVSNNIIYTNLKNKDKLTSFKCYSRNNSLKNKKQKHIDHLPFNSVNSSSYLILKNNKHLKLSPLHLVNSKLITNNIYNLDGNKQQYCNISTPKIAKSNKTPTRLSYSRTNKNHKLELIKKIRFNNTFSSGVTINNNLAGPSTDNGKIINLSRKNMLLKSSFDATSEKTHLNELIKMKYKNKTKSVFTSKSPYMISSFIKCSTPIAFEQRKRLFQHSVSVSPVIRSIPTNFQAHKCFDESNKKSLVEQSKVSTIEILQEDVQNETIVASAVDNDKLGRRPLPLLDLKISDKVNSIDNSNGKSMISGFRLKEPFMMESQDMMQVQNSHERQCLTLLSLELFICTRGKLMPDPEVDAITAAFYSIYEDDQIAVKTPTDEGILVLDNGESELCEGRDGLDVLKIICLPTELMLINTLVNLVHKYDVDIILGFEIEKVSWGFLMHRAAHLNIFLVSELSRIIDQPTKLKNNILENLKKNMSLRELHIPGRIVLNLWRIIKHELALNIYSFENIAFQVLHERYPNYSFQTLTMWFSHKSFLYRWRVYRYFMVRTQSNFRLIDKLDIIGQKSEFARIYGIQFCEVLSRGTQFRVESMMLRLAKPLNFICVSPSVHQRAGMRPPECIPLTLEPTAGMYTDPVIVLDFQSLYPSIMIAYNYCYSTCLGHINHLTNANQGPFVFGCTSLNITPEVLKSLVDDVNICPNGVLFVKQYIRKGIISSMVEEILNTRLMVKKSMKNYKNDKALQRLLHARQLGLKLIANTTFGYTAANFSGRMPCVEVGDSIVRKARETLERAIDLVEKHEAWSASVIYGDTDSLFVLLKGRSREEAFKIGQEIADAVTSNNPKPIKLKLEKIYQPCMLLTKKRYFGYMYESQDQKDAKFDAKGIETVRRDNCPLVGKIVEQTIRLLFDERDVSLVKRYMQRQCKKMIEGRFNLQDCIFAKEYRGRQGYSATACIPALEIARRNIAKDRCNEPLAGERVPYVIVHGYPGAQKLIHLVHHPHDLLEMTNEQLRINIPYYIFKQVLPTIQRIFLPLGINITHWFSEIPRVMRLSPIHTEKLKTSNAHIANYFLSTNCQFCNSVTNHGACQLCKDDMQRAMFQLVLRIRRTQSDYQNTSSVCRQCVGFVDNELECRSLDCPQYFKRTKYKKRAAELTNLFQLYQDSVDITC